MTLLTAGTLALCALTSCNLDKDYTFTYSNVANVSIADKADHDAVVEYMDKNFVETKPKATFFGKHYDAIEHFIQHYLEQRKKVDADFIYDHLKAEDDYVQLVGTIQYEAGDEWVGYYTWSAKDKKSRQPDE